MEKKKYVKPVLNSEEFVPQEYIAACGDSGTTFNFACDAGGGDNGDIFLDDGSIKGMLDKRDTNLTKNHLGGLLPSWFHACPKTHEVTLPLGSSPDDIFPKGFYVRNGGNDKRTGYEVIDVRIWTNGGTEVHATSKLNIKDWELAKS